MNMDYDAFVILKNWRRDKLTVARKNHGRINLTDYLRCNSRPQESVYNRFRVAPYALQFG